MHADDDGDFAYCLGHIHMVETLVEGVCESAGFEVCKYLNVWVCPKE